jgi:hypothetical protein
MHRDTDTETLAIVAEGRAGPHFSNPSDFELADAVNQGRTESPLFDDRPALNDAH